MHCRARQRGVEGGQAAAGMLCPGCGASTCLEGEQGARRDRRPRSKPPSPTYGPSRALAQTFLSLGPNILRWETASGNLVFLSQFRDKVTVAANSPTASTEMSKVCTELFECWDLPVVCATGTVCHPHCKLWD